MALQNWYKLHKWYSIVNRESVRLQDGLTIQKSK
jgi:hypothetical protein